jgi:hypothetical protein
MSDSLFGADIKKRRANHARKSVVGRSKVQYKAKGVSKTVLKSKTYRGYKIKIVRDGTFVEAHLYNAKTGACVESIASGSYGPGVYAGLFKRGVGMIDARSSRGLTPKRNREMGVSEAFNWRTASPKRVARKVGGAQSPGSQHKHYSLAQLQRMPTLESGHTDNLKFRSPTFKVWLSRMTKEDGMPYDNQVTVEHLVKGKWVTRSVYRAH